MKKTPIFLILTLLLSAYLSPPTGAREDPRYTVSELLEYRVELENEKQAKCGDDADCRQKFYYARIESDEKASALNNLAFNQFTITAINPGQEYIKVLFHGEDMVLAGMGIKEELTLRQVYIGWLEKNPERIFWDGMDLDQYINGEIPDAHQIYAWKNGDATPNLIENYIEVKLPAVGLKENQTSQLIYGVDASPGNYAAHRRVPYSDCLNHQDYEDGMECKLMVWKRKGMDYIPSRETTMSNNKTNDEEPEPSNTRPALEPQENKESAKRAEVVATERSIEPAKIKAPSTGSSMKSCAQKTIEFPWWLAILIALGDAAVLWLFWPKKSKK